MFRRSIITPLAVLTLAAAAQPAMAQTSSDATPGQLIELYMVSNRAMLEAVDGLTDEQWSFKPGPDRWSIAEVLEHVIIADTWGYGELTTKAVEKEVSDQMLEAAMQQEQTLETTLGDRSQKFQAPEQFHPTGQLGGPSDLVMAFKAERKDISEHLKTAEFDLRDRYAPHPIFGEMDIHTWAMFLMEHGNRHLQQIEEVKKADGYPAGQ